MSDWTNDRIEQLKALVEEGLSATQIARQLGRVSRNAVIGKLHRMGLLLKGASTQAKHQSRPYPRERHVPVAREARPKFDESLPEPESLRVSIMDIANGMCRWPHGDPAQIETFHFCGHPVAPNRPYCPYHVNASISVAATNNFQKAWGLSTVKDAA